MYIRHPFLILSLISIAVASKSPKTGNAQQQHLPKPGAVTKPGNVKPAKPAHPAAGPSKPARQQPGNRGHQGLEKPLFGDAKPGHHHGDHPNSGQTNGNAGRKGMEKSALANTTMDANPSPIICPTFGGGLFIALDSTLLRDANSLCLSAGLGLANLTFSNNFVAAQLLLQCGAGLGWISSFERVVSNTCAVLTGDGNIYYPDAASCTGQMMVAVCQDFAATITDTVTSTFTSCTTSTETDTVSVVSTSTLTIISTTTSTATGRTKCAHPPCLHTRTVFVPGGVTTMTVVTSTTTTDTLTGGLKALNVVMTTAAQVIRQPDKQLVVVEEEKGVDGVDRWLPNHPSNDCPMNVPACRYDEEFVLLRTFLPFSKADCACRRLGMRAASIDAFNLLKATAALYQCGGDYPAWIRSWDGNRYEGVCLALSKSGSVTVPGSCSEGLPVLCQRSGIHDDTLLAEKLAGAGKPNKLIPKVFLQHQSPVYSLCLTTQSNLFIVSSQTFLAGQDPSAACATFNLRPANVFDNTRAAAAAVFAVCSAGDPQAVAAQINAFDGLQGSACNLIDDTQAVLIVDNGSGEVASNCFVNQKYFLCEGANPPTPSVSTVFTGPFFFVTTTTIATPSVSTIQATTTVTVSTGTTVVTTEVELISLTLTTLTSTTTTTVKITSAIIPSSSSSSTTSMSSTSQTSTTLTVTTIPSCPAQLPMRCPLQSKQAGLVLLSSPLPNAQAECACRIHGLQLAALTVASFPEAADLTVNCAGRFQKAWVGGYGALDGGQGESCVALYVGEGKGQAAALPLACTTAASVLCEPLKFLEK